TITVTQSSTKHRTSSKSARDAIGTKVTATIGDSQFFHQLTAGDGYASCNERRIFVGCGEADEITRLSIEWPSGGTQVFTGVATSQSVVVVEGREALAVARLPVR
ncbi:MAG: TPP-dependent indolepyruvate ferredoxin oxidoreductase alpha subunit, partial [Planctomycetaceae bacterium]